jgi:hypothetical protein
MRVQTEEEASENEETMPGLEGAGFASIENILDRRRKITQLVQ